MISTLLLLTACASEAPKGELSADEADSAAVEERKLIAFTFDDGPNTSTMVEVLDILEEYNITATFFLIGDRISSDTYDVLKRAVDMGCELANHSWSHQRMADFSEEEIKEEIEKTQKKVFEVAGVIPKYFRPPYISVSETLYQSVKLPLIVGQSTGDSDKSVDTEERIERFISRAGHGKIMLMHCFTGNSMTVEALKVAIPELLDQGYEFVTVSELFEIYDYEPEANNGIMYDGLSDFE